MRSASRNSTPWRFMTQEKTSPPSLQAPKQRHVWRLGSTMNEGVFSAWKGHSALNVRPALRSATDSPTNSAMSTRALTSSTTLNPHSPSRVPSRRRAPSSRGWARFLRPSVDRQSSCQVGRLTGGPIRGGRAAGYSAMLIVIALLPSLLSAIPLAGSTMADSDCPSPMTTALCRSSVPCGASGPGPS